jgi:hypothetical protein
MTRRVYLAAGLCAVAAIGAVRGQADLSRGEGDSMERKLSAIEERGSRPAAPGNRESLRTSFTEREVNAYLKFNGQSRVPAGVIDPQVTIPGENRVTARAIVDLDLVRKAKPRTWLDPANLFLRGSVEIKAAGTLQASQGVGTFQLESASVGGVTIPKGFLQELVSYYSRTADHPEGFSLDQPFELPANIREIQIGRGAATVIQ